MKKLYTLCLALVLAFSMVGCADKNEKVATEELEGSYVYEKGGFSGIELDYFVISINDDGTFTYTEGVASSHLADPKNCSWKLENGILTLTEIVGENNLINHFKIEENCLIFQSKNSTGFIYTDVADGDKFYCKETAS